MILYPTIEILDGRCVSLVRGRLDEPKVWHVDPVQRAHSFAAAGAEWLHVTDFDGIRGSDRNRDLIDRLIRHSEAPIQLGGGFRNMHHIVDGIERGAGRIVLGTAAILWPSLVKQAAHAYPDQIVIALDVYQGRVMTHGWESASVFAPEDFIAHFDSDPLAAIIVTDIDADLEEAEEPLALVTRLARLTRTPVIASGLIRTLDDVSRLKYVRNVAGALIGRALFDRSVDLAEALAVAKAQPEPVADFL